VREYPHEKSVAKAVYNGPNIDGTSPGILWVSLSRPERFNRSELMTLMLHEAEPGHHLQVSRSLVYRENPEAFLAMGKP